MKVKLIHILILLMIISTGYHSVTHNLCKKHPLAIACKGKIHPNSYSINPSMRFKKQSNETNEQLKENLDLSKDPKTIKFMEYITAKDIEHKKLVEDSTYENMDYEAMNDTFYIYLVYHYLNEVTDESLNNALNYIDKIIAYKEFNKNDRNFETVPYTIELHSLIDRVPIKLWAVDPEVYELNMILSIDLKHFRLPDLIKLKDVLVKCQSNTLNFKTSLTRIFLVLVILVGYKLSIDNVYKFIDDFNNYRLTTHIRSLMTMIFYQLINVYFTVTKLGQDMHTIMLFGKEVVTFRVLLWQCMMVSAVFGQSQSLIQIGSPVYTQLKNSMKSSFFLSHKDLVIQGVNSEEKFYNDDIYSLNLITENIYIGWNDKKYTLLQWDNRVDGVTEMLYFIILGWAIFFDFILLLTYYRRIYIVNNSWMLFYDGKYDSKGHALTPKGNEYNFIENDAKKKNYILQLKVQELRTKIAEIRAIIIKKVDMVSAEKKRERQLADLRKTEYAESVAAEIRRLNQQKDKKELEQEQHNVDKK